MRTRLSLLRNDASIAQDVARNDLALLIREFWERFAKLGAGVLEGMQCLELL